MSYHSQAQTQQRSLGIIAVVAFHLVAILALTLGFKIPAPVHPDSPIKVNNLPQEQKPIEQIELKPIDVTQIQVSTPKQPDSFTVTEETLTPPPVTGGLTGTGYREPQFTKPSIIKATKPDYPSASTRLGEEGTTTLSLLINETGKVSEARIVKSSGYERLDQAAVKHAIRNWAFTPCKQDDKVVACWHSTNLVWKIENAAR